MRYNNYQNEWFGERVTYPGGDNKISIIQQRWYPPAAAAASEETCSARTPPLMPTKDERKRETRHKTHTRCKMVKRAS